MKLKETIKRDLTAAIKAKDSDRKAALRVILGEVERSANKASDDQTMVKVLRKLRKAEMKLLKQDAAGSSSPFLEIIESYLPQPAKDAEWRQWISANIDFKLFKSKMQAMKPIMAHFGDRAQGDQIRRILEGL